MNTLLEINNIKLLYNNLYSKKKERFDIILEPLQAIIQLALLKYCPLGTKITIHNNLIELQLPTYTQGILRWYNNDNKDDLFYLFNACKRFSLFYKYLKNISVDQYNLYDILIYNAKEGINKLVQTYNNVDKVSLLHTLNMYKLILDNPTLFDSPSCNYTNHNKDIEEINITNVVCSTNYDSSGSICSFSSNKKYTQQISNIDDIFSRITEIYSINDYNIILNLFIILSKCHENNYITYTKGLNTILTPINYKIKKWISENVVF